MQGEFTGIYESLENSFIQNESYTAFSYLGRKFSYSDLRRLVRNFSLNIPRIYSINKGDRILIILPPSLQKEIAFLSCFRGGYVPASVPYYISPVLVSKLLDSGLFSGLITYPKMFELVSDKTGGIFSIIADETEFSFSGKFENELFGKSGKYKKGNFEELCENDIDREWEDIDPYSDWALSSVKWKNDGSFKLLNYNAKTFMHGISKIGEFLPDVKNGSYIQMWDSWNPPSILMNCVLPILRGQNILPVTKFSESWIVKNINDISSETGGILSLNRDNLHIVNNIIKKIFSNIRIFLVDGYLNQKDIEFSGKRKNAFFSYIDDVRFIVPPYFSQTLNEKNRFSIEDEILIDNDLEIKMASSLSGREDFKTRAAYEDTGLILNDGKLLIKNSSDEEHIIYGRAIPVNYFINYMKEKYNLEILLDNKDEKGIKLKIQGKWNKNFVLDEMKKFCFESYFTYY
ncbi:hypothetical protein [Caldiplasma sukawensis]